jgi:hypothetical protein
LLSVRQVLQQLPEGLAIAVLAASPADLEQHLSILPVSLHPFAIEASFPSIRAHRSLNLDFASMRNPAAANMVLHAATAGTTEASALRGLELKNIPVKCNDCLQQLIPAACVRLDFLCSHKHYTYLPFAQLETALSNNFALTSLQLTFSGDPWHAFSLDCLFESLTGLRSIELSSSKWHEIPFSYSVHEVYAPRSISNLLCLTRLCLGPCFLLNELHQILPHMTRLQKLRLLGQM